LKQVFTSWPTVQPARHPDGALRHDTIEVRAQFTCPHATPLLALQDSCVQLLL
jgi:hypothetical protein